MKVRKCVAKFDSSDREQFCRYEAKLAKTPISAFIEKYSDKCHGKLVDVGCGSKAYRKYFSYIDEYIGVDLTSDKADIVADAKSLPIESNSVDVVLCNQVIEHDAEPIKIIAEICRILKKDGVLILSAPQMGRLHGEPNDYYRFTKWGLKYLLEKNGMKIEVIEPHGGIFRAVGSHLNFFIIEYLGKNKRRRYMLRRTILAFNNLIFSFLDKLVTWNKDTLGYNIIAKKEVTNSMAERAHPEDPGFREGTPYRANLFKRYAFANKFTEGKTVLDIPCGVGWGTSLLRAKDRIGIDISLDAVAYAKKHYPGIDFLVGDMANIPLGDSSVDVVVCLEGFEHVSKASGIQFLEEVIRVIKHNGLLVMTVPVILPGSKHSGNPYHLHEPTLCDLKNILAHRFYAKSMEIVKGPDSPIVYFAGSPKRKTRISKFSHEKGSVDRERKDISNILLTTSAAPSQSPFSTKEKRPPIGIGFLISVLRKAGHEVFFIDNYLQPNNFLETDYLQKHRIDYVGIYVNTICFRDTLRMLCKLEDLRQTDKWGGKIIVGGPHTTVAVDAIPGFVDYVVQGEGERAILDIVEDRVTDRIVSYPRIENLDALPMPAWDCFVDLPYDWSIGFFEDKPVFTMNTSRGCPFNCTFCSVGSVWGKKYTYFSAERIVSDIEYLINHYGLKGVYFREDNFTLNKERLRKFCNLLIEKGIKISWACESRVSNLTRDLVELMSRAGAKGFYFGVESGSQRILDFLRKDITVEQIKDAFEWCHEFNVKTAASLILGVPSETEPDRQETSELLKAIKPDVVWPNVFVGIPDSSLYRFVLNNKLYQYIDDRGLLYLQGHNSRVKRYYGDNLNACIPDNEENKDMTVKPKVSVLMSVYNCEKFIEQALRSVYNQTYQDFEVVIVDDGSTDKTADTLFNMKDSRTFIYRNSENKGLTKSLNVGLKLCRGEYVARMDADDVSYPQRFEKQVKFLDENPDCTALGCWCNRIDSKGQIHGAYDGRPTKPENIKRQLLVGNCVAHATAMVRRASLVQVGGYNEKYAYAQDHDLWLRLSEVGQIYNLGEYLVGLRFWPENITAKKSEQQDKCSELAIQEALQRRKGTEPAAAGKYHEQESDWKPSFSIVMANYNNAKYIVEAIESILRQTFRDWELIIVEDCSTDNSLEIISRYLSDKRIRLIRHERNRGYTAALKTGIEHVRAEHFGILDSDDCLTGPAIETMYSYHVRFPDCGLIYSQFVYCDEDLTPRQIGYCNKIPADKTNTRVNVVSGFKTFKMRDYLRTSGYDEDILYAEDKDIIYKMEEVTGLKFVDQCLYLARELPGSQSHDPNKALIGKQSDEKAKMNALRRRSQLPGKKQHSGITVNLIARYALGFSYLKAGKYSEAQITLEPMLTLLMQMFERGASQLSGPELEKYNVMAECYLRICTTLARCYLKQERYDKAERIYSHLLNSQYLGLSEEQKAAINAVLAKLENIRLPALSTEHSRQNLSPKGGESEPLVSVYMVTYNMERFIRQAIDSVLAQTCQNLELLIVDDGSTDRTKDIVASYSDNRIRYIYKPHKNFASGMNMAIREAKGEYLVGVDSDDYIEPDYIEKMVAFADKYPDIDYFYPATLTLIDESGNYTGVEWNYLDFSDNSVLPAFLFDRGYSPIPNSGSLKRRALFNKVELYEELETVEDFTFLCRNALKIRFKRVDEQAKYFYRRLPSSNSLRFKARNELTARAINEMVSIYPPEVLCPQIARISSTGLKKREYLKYVMTTFYKHADGNTSKYGEYYRQYGDHYRAELSQIAEPDITKGTFGQVHGETGLLDWFKQGFEHLKAARAADALACFNEARQLGDEMANLNYARAVALVQLGRMGDARSACEAELALWPDSQKARTLLNKISEAANAVNPAG